MQVIQIQMLNLISDAKLQKRERSVTWVKYFDSRTSVKHVNCQYMGNKNKRKKHNADQLIYCSPSQLVLTLLATYGHASIRPLKIRMWLLAACLTLMNRSVLWLFVICFQLRFLDKLKHFLILTLSYMLHVVLSWQDWIIVIFVQKFTIVRSVQLVHCCLTFNWEMKMYSVLHWFPVNFRIN